MMIRVEMRGQVNVCTFFASIYDIPAEPFSEASLPVSSAVLSRKFGD